MQITTWLGASVEWKADPAEKRTVDFKPSDGKDAVSSIRKLRESKDKEARDKLMETLPASGGFTGQFEPRMLSAPEGLLAAWLYLKGDKSSAATLLFPLLDELDDDRWAFQIVRDLVAKHCHHAMLNDFSYRRDYAKTIRMAKHLSQPLFDGFEYQLRAKELAAQLEQRTDDFKTLILPSAEDWKKTAIALPREKQVEFLASRLRLLNCFQFSQPGDVDYRDEQHATAGRPRGDGTEEGKPAVVINPYNELRALKLQPSDLITLAPFLKDDNFLPTYSYWRTFHPDRTLHRANWLVAKLINAAALHTLVDLDDWQDLPTAERGQRLEAVLSWANEMSGKSASEIIKSNMAKAGNEREWFQAAGEAARLKEAVLLPDLLAGGEKYPEKKVEIAEICFYVGSPDAAPSARFWIKLGDPKLKCYAALILARHGTSEDKQNALAVLKAIMAAPWEEEPLDAIGPMLLLNDPQVTEIACSILRRPEFQWGYHDWIAHQLFLSKHPAALTAMLDALANGEGGKERTGEWQGQEVKRKLTRGDEAAAALEGFRKDYDFPEYAPDGERAAARIAFGEWLKQQHALLEAAKPTPDLDTRQWRPSKFQIDPP